MILQCVNVHKSFCQGGKDIKVLKGLNMTMDSGESVALLGQSGSGKSTLLALLAGMDEVSDGQIIIAQNHIHTFNEAKLNLFRAQHLGIIFQQYHLLPNLTALENIELVLELKKDPQSKEKALLYLHKVGLEHRHNHMPYQLSGGENQRIAIARALVVKPDLLLADEPSGSLDEKTGDDIMALFFSLVKEEQKSMLLVTHNQALADSCDRQLYLQDGILQ